MIRVVYRWRVEPADFDAFERAWNATTNKIHASVPGARGSFMLRGHDDATEVLTVARWDSYDDWKRFWGDSKPPEMADMQEVGTQVSAHAYDEIEDFTR